VEFRSLKYFDTVARLKSVSDAARLLSVTQPAVSKQITALEADLGVRLFHRTSRGMALTAAGKTLFEFSADVLVRMARAEQVMEARYRGRPAFRVACQSTTAHSVVTPFMVDANPPIVDVRTVPTLEIDSTLDDDVDLGVSSMKPPGHRAVLEIGRVPILLQSVDEVTPRANLEDFTEQWIIVPHSGVETVVREALTTVAPKLPVRVVATGSVAQALATQGYGLALVTDLPRFDLHSTPVYADGRPLSVAMYASWDKDHFASVDIRRVATDLRRWMSEHAPRVDS
jgi:DNA-binding transcriptional LysR family regulator